MRKGELEADKDKMMREYRAQLDAERAIKLSKGRNHSSSKSSRKKGIFIEYPVGQSLRLFPSFLSLPPLCYIVFGFSYLSRMFSCR